MITNWRNATANVLGVLSVMALVFLWIFMLAPLEWHLHFPGGFMVEAPTLMLATALSFVAGICGRRIWFVVAAIAVLTVAYVWFFMNSPIWY
jgi:hypothetical protein